MESQQYTDEYTIDLRDIFRILRKRFWLIFIIPTIAVLTAGILAFFVMTPIYQSSTTLLVWRTPTTSDQVAQTDILANRQLVKTYREIARSNTIMQDVINKLSLSETPDQLRSSVEVSLRGDTEIIEISVDNPDPLSARVMADAVAASFMANVTRIMQVENVVVVDQANLPISPVKPQKMLIVAVAGFLGLMSSLFLAFILEYLDNTLKTPNDVERYLGLPVLASIPRFRPADLAAAPKGE